MVPQVWEIPQHTIQDIHITCYSMANTMDTMTRTEKLRKAIHDLDNHETTEVPIKYNGSILSLHSCVWEGNLVDMHQAVTSKNGILGTLLIEALK